MRGQFLHENEAVLHSHSHEWATVPAATCTVNVAPCPLAPSRQRIVRGAVLALALLGGAFPRARPVRAGGVAAGLGYRPGLVLYAGRTGRRARFRSDRYGGHPVLDVLSVGRWGSTAWLPNLQSMVGRSADLPGVSEGCSSMDGGRWDDVSERLRRPQQGRPGPPGCEPHAAFRFRRTQGRRTGVRLTRCWRSGWRSSSAIRKSSAIGSGTTAGWIPMACLWSSKTGTTLWCCAGTARGVLAVAPRH